MREIKFRMFKDGKMVYRNLIDRNWYYTESNDENGCNTAYLAMPEDRTNPIMQYTGLKDKNSVRIYEGDVLRGLGFVKYEAEYIPDKMKMARFVINIMGETNEVHFIELETKELEVIGNICENPGFLKDISL